MRKRRVNNAKGRGEAKKPRPSASLDLAEGQLWVSKLMALCCPKSACTSAIANYSIYSLYGGFQLVVPWAGPMGFTPT